MQKKLVPRYGRNSVSGTERQRRRQRAFMHANRRLALAHKEEFDCYLLEEKIKEGVENIPRPSKRPAKVVGRPLSEAAMDLLAD